MNYYDRIQKSIEFIERYIDESIDIQDAADISKMSYSEYCRFFHAITRYNIQEYIGKRKTAYAVNDMLKGKTDINYLAKKYCFSSTEAFCMIFRSNTGYLPSEFLDQDIYYSFEMIDVRKIYYDTQDKMLIERFPDIRLLRPFPKMRMASYTSFGNQPENKACKVIMEYAKANKYLDSYKAFRIFGFNVSDSIKHDGTYGYTVCMTVDDSHEFSDGPIKELIIENGQYVVATTTVNNLVDTWERFKEWLRVSGMNSGDHQYLEEHLNCCNWRVEEPVNDTEINLYMPVSRNSNNSKR